jgi:GntR family histidine utilization transcriptional repressor
MGVGVTQAAEKSGPYEWASNAAPLYAAVKQYVRERIDSGAWPAHHRIPSENELVSELGVSRMTANRALRELATEGAIVRIQGVGSFVAAHKASSALFDVRNIAEEIHERGHEHAAQVLLLQEEAVNPDLADALDLAIGSRIFHSILLHTENDVPIQIEDRFVNPVFAPRYLDQDFRKITPNAYLTEVAPITRTEQVVEAQLPQAWQAKLLAIPKAEPCLAIQRRTWSNGQSATFARLLYPGSRYRLEASSG